MPPFIEKLPRLIQKIYEVDPLLCPKCGGAMRVIAFIEERAVIEKILKHLGLWLVNSRASPRQARTGSGGELSEMAIHHGPAPWPEPGPPNQIIEVSMMDIRKV